MDKLLNHWLTQAGVGAGGTGLSTSKTGFNTGGECRGVYLLLYRMGR
jgi:hypothetical protein